MIIISKYFTIEAYQIRYYEFCGKQIKHILFKYFVYKQNLSIGSKYRYVFMNKLFVDKKDKKKNELIEQQTNKQKTKENNNSSISSKFNLRLSFIVQSYSEVVYLQYMDIRKNRSNWTIFLPLFIFTVISCLIHHSLQLPTTPLLWDYQTSPVIECGRKSIVPSNATIPQSPGMDYTITFANLKNASAIFTPAIGYVDIAYMFQLNSFRYVVAYSLSPSGGNFKLHVFSINADSFLSIFTINYLAVSKDLKQFFICINFHIQGVGIQINSTATQTFVVPFSIALPSLTNIKYVVSMINLNWYSNHPSNLFEQQFTINIINQTHYSWKLGSPLTKTYVYGMGIYVIFYQQVANPYSLTLQKIVNFNNASPITTSNSVVYTNNMADSFQVYPINSFFGMSRLAAVSNAIFSVALTSSSQIKMSITQTQVLQGDILIFRQSNPYCQSGYAISKSKTHCVCNSLSCFPVIGCSQIVAVNGSAPTCVYCKVFQNFYPNQDGDCVCRVGFQLQNNQTCHQICGDGIKFQNQCDDGNALNQDGCSSNCEIESDFQCNQIQNGLSVCLFTQDICFELVKINKNADNSAVFKFQTITKDMPFGFSFGQFEVYNTLNLTIQKPNSDHFQQIDYSIKDISDLTIEILVQYNETIQGAKSVITFDFFRTKYLSQRCTINFDSIGSGLPLLATQFTEQYGIASTINLVFIILITLIFFISLFAPKWIGIQAIQAIQLIFFSQMLIVDSKDWPAAFTAFKYFKYANGYNNIIFNEPIYLYQTSASQSFSNINLSKKWMFLQFQQLFLSNFLISQILLITLFIILIVASNTINNRENEYFLIRQKGNNKNAYLFYRQMSKISQKVYQITLNIVMWSLLQFLASIACQVSFQGYSSLAGQQILLHTSILNILSIPLCFLIIVFVSLSNLLNIWLSKHSTLELAKKPQLLTYKWINFSYHLVLGIEIFCCNTITIKMVPFSVLVIFGQIIYIYFLLKLRPYKQCLKIHEVSLIFIRVVFLSFLCFITLKNLVKDLNETIMLIMCGFIIFSVLLIIVLSCVRLYYDLRYGQKLEDQLNRQRQLKQLQDKRIKKQKRIAELQLQRNQTNKLQVKLTQKQKSRKKNKYLYENQVQEDEQMEYLKWLQKRNILTEQEKEIKYFEKYAEKPLKWLEIHDPKQFHKRVKRQQEEKQKKQKLKHEEDVKQLAQLKENLKKECFQKKMGNDRKVYHRNQSQ